jgi:hypothetical protein
VTLNIAENVTSSLKFEVFKYKRNQKKHFLLIPLIWVSTLIFKSKFHLECSQVWSFSCALQRNSGVWLKS